MDRKLISAVDTLELIRTPSSQYTTKLLREWMANTKAGGARYPNTAIIEIPSEFRTAVDTEWDVRHAPNWGAVRSTTVGRFVVNNLVFSASKELRSQVPYYDVAFNSGKINDIQQHVMDLYMLKKISYEDITSFIDTMQWLGYGITMYIAPSMSINTIRPTKAVSELKATILASERGDSIRGGNLVELGRVEKELLNASEKELDGNDPGMQIFKSGARGSWGNNYKNTALMRGAIRKSDDPSSITISTASLNDGIPMDEIPAYADLLVQASYGRAMLTAQGGYFVKQLNAAFQSLALNPDAKSNCRTPLTMDITLSFPREYLYRYYREGNTEIEILPENLDGLKGKTVKMRTPLFCGDKTGLCSHCAGTLYHRLGVNSVGLITGRVGSTILNGALKAFHDTSLKLSRIDLNAYTRKLTP